MQRRNHDRRVGAVLRALLVLTLWLAPWSAFAAPVVYHSPADDGAPGTGSIPAGAPATLHLYVDPGSVASTSFPCERGDGDELCGYVLTLRAEGGLALGGVAVPGDGAAHVAGDELRIVGGDPVGALGPIELGDVEVSGPDGARLVVAAGDFVDSALERRAFAPANVVHVPEPVGALTLLAGSGLLALLRRRRLARGALLPLLTLLWAGPATAQATNLFDTEASTFDVRGGAIVSAHGCGGEFEPPESLLELRTIGGSNEEVLWETAGCGAERLASVTLSYRAGGAYWAGSDGEVLTVATFPSGQTPVAVAAMASPLTPTGVHVATDDQYVYWNEGASIYRAPRAGGSRQLLSSAGAPLIDLRVGGSGLLFYRLGDTLYRFGLFSGPFGDFWASVPIGTAQSYALGNGRVYWADGPLAGGATTIRSELEEGGGAQVVAGISGVGSPVVSAMAVNSGSVFWLERRGPNGDIWRRTPGEPTNELLVIGEQAAYHQFAATEDELLWLDTSANALRHLPVDADALYPPNLVAEGLEVVQVVQEPGNGVPLVEGKETIARLSATLVPGAGGALTARPWPIATLEGTRDGAPLPGSPLLPEPGWTHPIGTGLPDRTTFAEGLAFRLPGSWTAGDVTLTARVNPDRVLPETYLLDNDVTVNVGFLERAPICAVVMPVRTIAGTVGGRKSWYRSLLDRGSSLLPTRAIRWFWPGGEPWEEYEFPFSSGPYEVSRSDNDVDLILARLEVHDLFRDDPEICDQDGVETHQVVFVPPGHPDPAVNGAALGTSQVTFMNFGADPSNTPANRVAGGITLAHELGHNYDRGHVDCSPGDPDGPDPGYPYPTCQLDDAGPDAHVGYDPITRTLLAPTTTADLLSYGHRASPALPRWPSDYTYEAILSRIPTGFGAASAMGPLGLSAASGGAAGSERVVMAREHPGGTDFELDHAFELTPAASAKADVLFARLPLDPTRVVEQRDAQGQLLSTHGVVRMRNDEDHEGPGAVLARFVPHPDLAELVVYDIAIAAPVARKTAGPAAPVVTISQPKAGTEVAGQLDVAWDATDADGDDLRYLVRYSRDDGATWEPLASQTPFDQLSRSTRGLAGCTACRIEVSASDGLRTTTAVSDAFSVVADPLELEIAIETADDALAPGHVSVRQSTGLTLVGLAYSDADGTLLGDALQWSVTGPVDVTGSGERLRLEHLPPGSYVATLSAADGEGLVGSSFATFDVEPKEVRVASTPLLDGDCDDDAYLADADPIALRPTLGVGEESHPPELRMIDAGGSVWLCAAGLEANGLGDDETLVLQLDVDAGDGDAIAPGDLSIGVSDTGGFGVAIANGAGQLTIVSPPPPGFEGAATDRGDSLSMEVRVPASALAEQLRLLAVHARSPGAPGQIESWPAGAAFDDPTLWGAVRLGDAPRIELDMVTASATPFVDPAGLGVIVGVPSNAGLDATTDLVLASLQLEPGFASPADTAYVDYDGDQLPDLVLLFEMDDLAVDEDSGRVCLHGTRSEGTPFVRCHGIVPTCAPPTCDADADGTADALDLCPWIPDSGLDSGGFLTSAPDGVGDDCTCGDWDDDGRIDAADPDALRAHLAGVPAADVPVAKCDINEDHACDVLDDVILRRVLQGLGGPGLRQTCEATRP